MLGIVDKIHNLNPPGRFLIKYEKVYIGMTFVQAVDKTRRVFHESDEKSMKNTAEVLTAVDNQEMSLPKKAQELRGDFFRSAKAKTELCRHYTTPKGCAFGDKCNYAHGEHELVKD